VRDPKRFLAAVMDAGSPSWSSRPTDDQGRKARVTYRSLATKDEIYDAVFRQYGSTALPPSRSCTIFQGPRYVPPPAGPRMLIVTSSGGSAIIATDVAADNGFRVSPLRRAGVRAQGTLPSISSSGTARPDGDGDAERFRQSSPPHGIITTPS